MSGPLLGATFFTLFFAFATPIAAQDPASADRLEGFITEVAALWDAGDVGALIDRSSDLEPLRLDTGSGTEVADDRHAAAALRELFRERRSAAARAVQITLAGTDPATGFGRLDWTYQDHGAPAEQTRSVYVAAVWEAGAWKISELRLMP